MNYGWPETTLFEIASPWFEDKCALYHMSYTSRMMYRHWSPAYQVSSLTLLKIYPDLFVFSVNWLTFCFLPFRSHVPRKPYGRQLIMWSAPRIPGFAGSGLSEHGPAPSVSLRFPVRLPCWQSPSPPLLLPFCVLLSPHFSPLPPSFFPFWLAFFLSAPASSIFSPTELIDSEQHLLESHCLSNDCPPWLLSV